MLYITDLSDIEGVSYFCGDGVVRAAFVPSAGVRREAMSIGQCIMKTSLKAFENLRAFLIYGSHHYGEYYRIIYVEIKPLSEDINFKEIDNMQYKQGKVNAIFFGNTVDGSMQEQSYEVCSPSAIELYCRKCPHWPEPAVQEELFSVRAGWNDWPPL